MSATDVSVSVLDLPPRPPGTSRVLVFHTTMDIEAWHTMMEGFRNTPCLENGDLAFCLRPGEDIAVYTGIDGATVATLQAGLVKATSIAAKKP